MCAFSVVREIGPEVRVISAVRPARVIGSASFIGSPNKYPLQILIRITFLSPRVQERQRQLRSKVHEYPLSKMPEWKRYFNRTTLCIGAVVIIIILIVGLAVGFTVKKYQAEKKLKYTTTKFELPTHYFARRPKGDVDIYKDMLYLTPGSKDEIGHARKCLSCFTKWTVYMMNNDDEIAVVIKKKLWSLTAKYDIEEQWKENATSYKVEYSWSGSLFTNEVFIIKNSKGDEIARTDRFRMEFGKTITVKDAKNGSLLGKINRPAFQLFSTWEITVNNNDVVPAYLFGAIATITTLKESEDSDKKK